MICKACGNEIDEDVDFCYFCGVSFDDEEDFAEDEIEDEIAEAGFFECCPRCGEQLRKGKVEITDPAHLVNPLVMATWYPEEEKDTMWRKTLIALQLEAEGYYCEKCGKVIAIFDRD